MLAGMYSAASGIEVAQKNHEVIAENLAHVSVPGYRRSEMTMQTFESLLTDPTATPSESGLGSAAAEFSVNFTPGPIVSTGRPLDFAIQGDGFFVVEGDSGPLYTRNGSFHLDQDGKLVTAEGREVLSDGGSLTFPTTISPTEITLANDGGLSVNGVPQAKLQLARFENTQTLERVGTTLFGATTEAPTAEGVRVRQGMRESSNVTAVDEMVRMIIGLRHHELAQKALRTLDEAIQLRTDPNA